MIRYTFNDSKVLSSVKITMPITCKEAVFTIIYNGDTITWFIPYKVTRIDLAHYIPMEKGITLILMEYTGKVGRPKIIDKIVI